MDELSPAEVAIIGLALDKFAQLLLDEGTRLAQVQMAATLLLKLAGAERVLLEPRRDG